MNRKLTPYETGILFIKARDWSYETEVKNGLIALGNGNEEDGTTAFLPYELLMNPAIHDITLDHVLLKRDL